MTLILSEITHSCQWKDIRDSKRKQTHIDNIKKEIKLEIAV